MIRNRRRPMESRQRAERQRRTVAPCDCRHVAREIGRDADIVQRAFAAWPGNSTAGRRRNAEKAMEEGGRTTPGGRRRETYFCPPSTGLPACLRAPSAPLTEVVIFSCARPPERFEDGETRAPFTLEPLMDVAAAEPDMGARREGRRPVHRLTGTGGSAQEPNAEKGAGMRRGECGRAAATGAGFAAGRRWCAERVCC